MGEELFNNDTQTHSPIEEHREQPGEGDSHLGGVALTAGGNDVPESYTLNQDKAEVMARAQNDAFDAGEQFPQNASLRAGIEYDMNVAKANTKGYEPNAAEVKRSQEQLLRHNINKRNQVLRYSAAIVEHYKQTKDKPSPALAALAAVHELVQDTGYEDFEIETNGDRFAVDNVRVALGPSETIIVESGDELEDRREKFTLSMFHGANYEVSESSGDADQEFDELITTKRRTLGPADVIRLREILAPAIAYRKEEKRRSEEFQQAYYGNGSDGGSPADSTDSLAHQAGWSETQADE